MKLFKQNNLDEFQEQTLLQIERSGCWLAFTGLLIALFGQIAADAPPAQWAGEWAVFMVLALYLLVRCLRAGIWDRHFRPNLKTNAAFSLLSGAAVALLQFFTYRSAVAALFVGVVTALLTLGTLQLCCRLYKKRRIRLETENNEEETHG
jgi:hypothetical protein